MTRTLDPDAARRHPTEPPVIGFLTDFGLDGAAATCRGVMLGICRDARIVDISHSVAKYAIGDGAFLLRSALPYLPVGVHVGVVDPGVGTERRAIGIRTGRGDVLIGPDNGLLVEPGEALGGISEARELTNRELWLEAPTHTFHGRDIFSPVAAHLAADHAEFADVGELLDVAILVRLERRTARVFGGRIEASVIYVDSFGNLRLSATGAAVEAAFGPIREGTRLRAEIGGSAIAVTWAASFGHVEQGAGVLYRDSSGNLAAALNQGDLAAHLDVGSGSAVVIGRDD
jgi:S-adenosylmethionine hydrolase